MTMETPILTPLQKPWMYGMKATFLWPHKWGWWRDGILPITLWWTDITMENHHFSWVSQLYMAIFNSKLFVYQRVFIYFLTTMPFGVLKNFPSPGSASSSRTTFPGSRSRPLRVQHSLQQPTKYIYIYDLLILLYHNYMCIIWYVYYVCFIACYILSILYYIYI